MNQHNKHEKSKSNCEIHVHSYRMKKKKQLIQEDVLECPLCQTLFYQPITTSCGHTFCKNCILRFNLTQKNSSIFFFFFLNVFFLIDLWTIQIDVPCAEQLFILLQKVP